MSQIQRGLAPGAREASDELLQWDELRRLRALVETVDLGYWDWNLRTGRVFYSEAWKRQLGCAEAALRDDISEWEQRIHEQDSGHALDAVRAFIAEPRPHWKLELRMRHADGSQRDVTMQLSLMRDGRGEPERLLGSQLDITDRQRTAHAHEPCIQQGPAPLAMLEREREAQMQLLFDAVPHMITVMELDSGGVAYANATWRDFYGQDISKVTRADRLARIHPDDRHVPAIVQAAVAEQLKQPAPELGARRLGPHMVRMRDPKGEYRWFSIHTTFVRPRAEKPALVIATATDVHALKQSEDSLSEAQARLQAALRVGGIGLLVWETREQRMRWDDSLLRLIGRTRADVDARSVAQILELLHEDDREAVRAAGERSVKHGEPLEIECRVVRPDGSLTSLAIKGGVERHGPDQPVRMIAAVVDVTERKLLEAEVLQAQKMDAIGQLAGGIAHDFNNLLTIILGQLSLLQIEEHLPEHVEASLQDIHQAADRAAALTRQLLAFGRRQLMQARTVDLNVVVADTLKMLRRIVGDGISLELDAAPLPVTARVDTNMLSQLLLNLTVNARDATARGGRCVIRTSIQDLDDAAAARLSGAKAGRWACISVQDTGSGIAADVLPHVFEPFFTTKKLGQGTGLGLSTVYGILKQHGGFVHVESTLGVGSIFQAYLPWVSSTPAQESARSPQLHARSANGARILLVEDEPSVRAVTRVVLAQHGHRVSVAENAQDALRLWKDQSGAFDLLLTDMMMPGMTGLELIEVLRKERPDLKAILCSGYSLDIALTKSASPLERVALLQKPWKSDTLLRCVTQMLDGSGVTAPTDATARR